MIATKAPIGEIINYIHKNPTPYGTENLFKKIESLMDLIVIRTKKKGVNKALDSLMDDLFKLRFEVIDNHELVGSVFEQLSDLIEDRIEKQYSKSTDHKDLEYAFVNAIDIYGKIASSIIEKVSNNPFVAINNLSSFEYGNIETLLKSLPGQDSQIILSYLKSSIVLDYSFIVSELIFDGELHINKTEISRLYSLLKNSIEEFAVYSNVFKLWSPDESDESQWMRNIKIRISVFEAILNTKHSSSDELKKVLAA
ncbi:hypothetical protein JMN32_21795 [Fulvivirga sp. 29W222]|uniref:Uncharacterized protein n=1 Tax=Fulvivirga marina TaxID=2494733 RepID=A0A937FZC5_9BACT|nr:hypothetical protein [Fulvivirga marina]MBL6448959.1 hypothetical protein [Fulvivirga marina]